jgi:hypothetical protein
LKRSEWIAVLGLTSMPGPDDESMADEADVPADEGTADKP